MKKENKTEQEEDKKFQYRTYGKGELAMLYITNVLQQSAVDEFNEWIAAYPGLPEQLAASGFKNRNKRYTPAQVHFLANAFGEP